MKYTLDDVQKFYFTLEKMADGDGRVSIDAALVVAFGVDRADFDAALLDLGHMPDDRATDALAAAEQRVRAQIGGQQGSLLH